PSPAPVGRPSRIRCVLWARRSRRSLPRPSRQPMRRPQRSPVQVPQPYPAVIEPEEAMQLFAPQLTPMGNIGGGGPEVYERGDLQRAEAEVVYERRYATEVQPHNPPEPHGCVASWDRQMLVLWDSN